MSDGLRYKIGDRVAAKTSGAEMGTVKSIDRVNRSITVEYVQKFNGKESTRERTFPENQLFNQTEMNEHLGKELLKTVNTELKQGSSINPKKAYEDAYKNGTMTQKVGNGIGLVHNHLEQLKKDGLLTEEKGSYKLADGVDPKQLDTIKVTTDMNGLAAQNASGTLKQGLGERIDNWIMDKTDVKTMGSGWKDFKLIHDSITTAARIHANHFYAPNSKEFAALDAVVTELFSATYAAAAVTAKWGAKNLGRGAYKLAKAIFGRSQNNNFKFATTQKIDPNMQKLQQIKNQNLNAEKAYQKFHADAQLSRNELQKQMQSQPTREQAQREKFEKGESVFNTKEAQSKLSSEKISTKEFTKELSLLKASYQKELKALNSKYDKMLDKLEKTHVKEKTKEQTNEKTDEKEQTKGR